ncbi:hypothetical protein GO013_07390 [Pseudodesulfovibrio sp. JC047]|uniref:hypothetical protein n=1 Tax=Pseudodesulfovibrio sp. JC047 TaxID=2683199 RepID=UPI0013D292CF|nr:hypothetical protein [Pseudodesulfovibrio sp. JC047]NDV19242.1 hypothetical protein [Pseudodesulfovibrio sp. JC047]
MPSLGQTKRPTLAITLLLCILSACTPKHPTNLQEWDTLVRKTVKACMNGDQKACRQIKEIRRQYEKDYPCPYTRPPKNREKIFIEAALSCFNGNIPDNYGTLIHEAEKNNFGFCDKQRSSFATTLRFAKGSGLYLVKKYGKSAQEYQKAFAEIGPDNNIDKNIGIPFLAFYPAALIKAGDIQSANNILKTPIFTPIQQLDEPLIQSLFERAEDIFPSIEAEQYSIPVLIGTLLVVETNENGNQLVKLTMIDALKTLAPFTPVPKFILKDK